MHAIELEAVGKFYKQYARPAHRLLEWASFGAVARHGRHWVLREIGFRVQRGQGLGVIGVNGAGKSTLLKIIKGTVRPNEGVARCAGRVAALELGLGFHPDFSGRDNAVASGAFFGLDAATVTRLLPEIEAFAEIGDVLDAPVRTYSSGMQLRLAFAVATARRPEILIIDEALAVGDAYFQQKCVARIRRFREEGTTLLLASHDPSAIKTLCDRALLLDGGRLVREGEPDSVLDYYNALIARKTAEYEIREGESLGAEARGLRSGDGRATIESLDLTSAGLPVRVLEVGAELAVAVEGRVHQPIDDLTVGISIRDRLGNEVFGTNTHHAKCASGALAGGDRFRALFRFPANLGSGRYSLTAALHAGSVHIEGSYDWWDKVLVFQVVPGGEPPFVGAAFLPTQVALEVESPPRSR
jgi:lipopolysaccharide transport system ATP-binding protein